MPAITITGPGEGSTPRHIIFNLSETPSQWWTTCFSQKFSQEHKIGVYNFRIKNDTISSELGGPAEPEDVYKAAKMILDAVNTEEGLFQKKMGEIKF